MTRFLSGSALVAALTFALAAIPVVAFAQGPRYIVKFNAGRSEAGRAALRGAGAQIVLSLDPQSAVAALIPERALAGLSRNPNIEYIEVDQIRTPMATWSDMPLSSGEILPYGIQMVQADLVTSANPNAKKVCIIDSGYSQQHEDLRDEGDGSITHNGVDSGSGTWDQDSCGHGTHVAGTISAIAGNGTGVIGVFPQAKLHIVKVFGDDALDGGSCAWTYSSTLVKALNSCTTNGADVVSMSLGGAGRSRTEEVAFGNAYRDGVLSIAAAGNDGTRRTSYPAGYSSVVSVAAVDNNETKADFSQFNRDVELAAPGVGVLSSVPWLENNTFTAGGDTLTGGPIKGAVRTSGYTNTIVDGGRCTTAGPWPAGAVVLCQRGDIAFVDKVNNVRIGGGGAAVIYNNVTSDATCGDFAGTLGDGVTSSIPAIGVSCADGVTALGHAGALGTVVSLVTLPASDYEPWNGTSMATPHVAGVAALLWSCYPDVSNQTIRDTLNATALDKGPAGRDTSYGYGIVQAKAAVDSLGGSSFCTTTTTSKY